MASARRPSPHRLGRLALLAAAHPAYLGGQAVINGVMMRGPDTYAVAVRKPDGSVAMKTGPVTSLASRHPIARLPFVRGLIGLAESMKIGMGSLRWSAAQSMPEGERELGRGSMGISTLMAIVFFMGVFVALPATLARILGGGFDARWQLTVLEGTIRFALFVGYLVAIGRLPDVRRLFQYHGAEHKTIAAFEAGDVVTPHAADRYSTRHVRCGTNFVLIVMALTVAVYSVLGRPSLPMRVLSEIFLVPLVVGISYELIRLAAAGMRYRVVRILMAPGLALQRVTTRPPSRDQLEVAVTSLRAAMSETQRAEVETRLDAGFAPMRWVGAAIPLPA